MNGMTQADLAAIREAAEQQIKIEQRVAAEVMKAATGAYEMARRGKEILRILDEAEKDGVRQKEKHPVPTPVDFKQFYGGFCSKCRTRIFYGDYCPGCGRRIEGGGKT